MGKPAITELIAGLFQKKGSGEEKGMKTSGDLTNVDPLQMKRDKRGARTMQNPSSGLLLLR